jgi:hypothetical protein
MINIIYPRFITKTTALTEGSLIFRDLSFVRTAAAHTFNGISTNRLYVQFINCNFDFAGFTGTMRNNSDLSFYGCDFTNYNNNVSFSTGLYIRVLRGNSGNLAGLSYTHWNTCGNSFTNPNIGSYPHRDVDGLIIYNNSLLNYAAANGAIGIFGATAGGNVGAFAVVQNLIERTGSTSFPSITFSADAANGNVVHGVVHHNTVAGDGIYSRFNWLYDDTPATARFHKLFSAVGNIGPELNTKSDLFMDDGTRQGNWAFNFGVGVNGNYTEDGVPADFDQDYGGIGSVLANGDVLFTDDKAVTASGPTAGAGGGTYTLQSGSPARDIVTRRVLTYDITGAARPTSGTIDAGAYA